MQNFRFTLWQIVGVVLAMPAAAQAANLVYLEEMTSAEVSVALRGGTTTVIIPVGGTEQNGLHMVLGKHNTRAKVLAGQVAQRLGDALVAPVVSYVPEGNVSPPTEHMRFAGTISIPEPVFRATLEAAARSFKQHGFKDIVLLGDSGNYQTSLKVVANTLNRDWGGSPVRAHFLPAYYQTTQTDYAAALKARGLTDTQIGTHAGTADTSLAMAVDPALVHVDRLEKSAQLGAAVGTKGDPRPSSVALGKLGIDAILNATVNAVRAAVAQPR